MVEHARALSMRSVFRSVQIHQLRWLPILGIALLAVVLLACGSGESAGPTPAPDETKSGEDSRADGDEGQGDEGEAQDEDGYRQTPVTGQQGTTRTPSSAGRTPTPTARGTTLATEAPTATDIPATPAATVALTATVTPVPPPPTPTHLEQLSAGWDIGNDGPLFVAAMEGTASDVRNLLGDYSTDDRTRITNKAVGSLSYSNLTPLHLAAGFNDDPEVVSALLEAGADIEAFASTIGRRFTPLLFGSSFNTEPKVVEVLLEWGANINANDGSRRTSAQLAALFNPNPEVVLLLLDWGPVSESVEPLYHPVALAGYNSNPDVIQALVESGAAGENEQELLDSALRFASGSHGSPETLKRVLDLGADISQKGRQGANLLHNAARYAHPGIVAVLLEQGMDIEAKDDLDRTPLFWALDYAGLYDPSAMVEFLLEQGADIEARDDKGNTLVLYAAGSLSNTNYRWVNGMSLRLLLENGVDPDASNDAGDTLMALAVQNGDWPTVNILVEHGADTSMQDSGGNTLLHFAAQQSRAELVKQLLEQGADRKATNAFGRTPCLLARGEDKFYRDPIAGSAVPSLASKFFNRGWYQVGARGDSLAPTISGP